MGVTTKGKAQLYTEGASIDANYGPWASTSAYEAWVTNDMGLAVRDGVTIAVKAADGKITKYVRENGAWRVDGGDVVTKASLGLGNVDNTSDANKPISSAVQSALDLKANNVEVASALALKADASQVGSLTDAANSAAASASNAAAAAASVAANSTAIAAALDEIKGSDDIPAATIAKVAENSGNISELEQKVTNEDLLLHTKHLYRSSFLDSGYINLSNGVIKTDQTGYVNTGYVEIDRTKKIIYKGDSSNEYLNVLAYYDSNKSFISGVSNIDAKGNETIHVVELDAIPSNARYVVVCAKYTDKYAFFSVPVTTKYLQQQVDEVSLQLVRLDGISSIGCNKKLEITFASAWNDVDVFIPKGVVITSIEDDLVLFSNYPVKGENGKITKSRCPYEVADDITLIRASVAGTHTLYFDDLEVEQLKTEVAELKELVNEGREELHAKSEFTITGCLNVNGNALQDSATDYISTDYISIPKNCTKIEVMSGSHNQYNVSGFAIYNAAKEVTKRVAGLTPNGYSSYVDEYVPTSADKFIRASGLSSGDCYIKFTLNLNSGTITVEDKKLIASSESMTGTQKLSVGVLNVQSRSCMVFRANVSSFSGLKIGNANSYNWYGSWLEIDGSTVKQYYNIGENKLANTMSHGLTITGDVYVCIEHKDGWNAHLVIATKGNVFETDITNWYGCAGECFAQTDGSSFSNCKLSWTCDGFSKDILVVSDSYLGWNKNRFNGWLQSWGYDVNALWDGYPGKPSNLDTIKTYLSLYTPKYIVYALGMNSKDNADSATTAAVPNATWKSNVDELKTLCQSKGIELVLCTIPSVNGGTDVTQDSGISGFRYNGAKNAYVKASGLRYIDFASAVNANDTTGNWNTGMLGSDGVHPTTQGALMLAMQMLSDFPEIAHKSITDVSATIQEKVVNNETDISKVKQNIADLNYIDIKLSPNNQFSDISIDYVAGDEGYIFTNRNIFDYVKDNNFYVFLKSLTVIVDTTDTTVKIFKMGYDSSTTYATKIGLYKTVTLTDSMKVSDNVYKIDINEYIDFVPALNKFKTVSSGGSGTESSYAMPIHHSTNNASEIAMEAVFGESRNDAIENQLDEVAEWSNMINAKLSSDVKTSPNTAMADFSQTYHSGSIVFTNKNIFNYVKDNDFSVFVKYITIKVPSSANGVVSIYKMGYDSTNEVATLIGLYKSITLTDSMKVSGTDDVYKIVINDTIDFVPAFRDFYTVSSGGNGGVASGYGINISSNANQEYAVEVVFGVEHNTTYEGITINFLGDSVTEQGRFTSAVVNRIGCVAINYGVSGTTITSTNNTTSFVERYSAMGDADVIFVNGGSNDWSLGRPLGTFEDGKKSGTFYGALHVLFEGLINKYPNKPILCGTPLHANYEGGTIQGVVYPAKPEFTIGDNGAITSVTYGNGAKLSDYVTAIKRVAEYYAIPVVDFYSESGMCPMISSNSSQYYTDGLHPNANGGNKMAVLFADALSKVL